jgi:hypothetical protein
MYCLPNFGGFTRANQREGTEVKIDRGCARAHTERGRAAIGREGPTARKALTVATCSIAREELPPFRLRLASPALVEPLPSITLRPKDGVRVTVSRR